LRCQACRLAAACAQCLGPGLPQLSVSAEGEYVIEGHGVDPDIEVEKDPADAIEDGG
jgi:hypothetical protein